MIEEYEKKINNYNYKNRNLNTSVNSLDSLKGQLSDIVTKLVKESIKLDSATNTVGYNYEVDDVSIVKIIVKNKSEVDSVVSYIKGIISGLDTEVSNINKQIESNNRSISYYKRLLKALKGSDA